MAAPDGVDTIAQRQHQAQRQIKIAEILGVARLRQGCSDRAQNLRLCVAPAGIGGTHRRDHIIKRRRTPGCGQRYSEMHIGKGQEMIVGTRFCLVGQLIPPSADGNTGILKALQRGDGIADIEIVVRLIGADMRIIEM